MRLTLTLTLALAACAKSPPPISNQSAAETPSTPDELPPPDRAQLAAMSFEDRCSAVAPRALPCVDELLVADASSLPDDAHGDVAAIVKESIRRDGRASASEAAALHRTECVADDDYPADVMTCWARTDCAQFATCVAQQRAARAAERKR